jgi:MFS family permease
MRHVSTPDFDTSHGTHRLVMRAPASLLVTMCLAVLLAQVDTSVVNLAMRSIGKDLQASVTGLQWVLDGYNISYALLLLTGGLLCDLYGRRRLFVIGAAVFTGGSVVCAAAPTIAMLIAGRAVAGVGAALLLRPPRCRSSGSNGARNGPAIARLAFGAPAMASPSSSVQHWAVRWSVALAGAACS